MRAERVLLAKIAAAHGVKGLVKILFYGEDISLLETGPLYTAETGDEAISVTLKNASGKYRLAEIEGVSTREQAEAIRGTPLYIDRAALPAIEEDDTYYHEDLTGLRALDEAGRTLGHVASVQNFGASDLLSIKLETGRACLVPFTDTFVSAVNITEGYVTLTPAGVEMAE